MIRNTAALVSFIAQIAQLLSGCSSLPQSFSATSAAAQYPDLNDAPPIFQVRADQVAHIKAELGQARDDQERAAAQQQALH
jgi:starvation-inducible outer membrane lipoprotein